MTLSSYNANLQQQLLAAHAKNDTVALVTLYTCAADSAEKTGDIDQTCFFLTHAFVFALSIDHATKHDLNKRLVAHGRDDALPEGV